MLSYKEALDRVVSYISEGPLQTLPLRYVLGAVLAEPVSARVSVPAFDTSAMDGFALDHRVTQSATPEKPVILDVIGTQGAGPVTWGTLKPGRALRIMTGAYFPMDATAVIEQEAVQDRDNIVVITSPVAEGRHVRRRGEDTQLGDQVLSAGVILSAPVVGYLSSIGVAEVTVYSRPRVGILPTGSELVPAGGALGPGQIYDCNSVALSAACQSLGVQALVYPSVADDETKLTAAIKGVLDENDVVIITGGVSQGRYDHVCKILEEQDVKTHIHGVRQKPGKPFYFGARNNRAVFGLPGNPVSSLIGFYEYVRPAIRKWMGFSELHLPTLEAVSQVDIAADPQRTQFLRAQCVRKESHWQVTPVVGQESHRMRSFATANAVIVIPEGSRAIAKGDVVTVQWILPH